jgi:hypothetical protein
MKKIIAVAVLGLGVVAGGIAVAKEPVRNVSKVKHPNIAAAQKLVDQAYAKITAAQKANEYELGGHAAKAKDLLEQANTELKAAAEESNENH